MLMNLDTDMITNMTMDMTTLATIGMITMELSILAVHTLRNITILSLVTH